MTYYTVGMSKLGHFITYNNLVPITISVVLLGGSATFAYNNPETIYERSERVITIDNSYIAGIDFDSFSPSVVIRAVEEDDDTYYVSYRFTTIALVDSVWQNVVSDEELVIPKANLGAYRDLGLFVTKELRELVLAEEKRLRETQVFEQRNVTRKQLAIEYSGLLGGRLSPETQTIAGYDPLVTPPGENAQRQTFAGPDARSTVSKPVAISTPSAPLPAIVAPLAIIEPPIRPAQAPSSADTDQANVPTSPATTTTPTTTQTTTTTPPTTTPVATTSPTTSGSGTGGSGNAGGSSTTTQSTSTIPIITLLGASTIDRVVGDSYAELGIVISDTSDSEPTTTITVNGSVVSAVTLDTSQPGEYTITYLVTNETGGSATVARLVRVLPAPSAPPVTNVPPPPPPPAAVDESEQSAAEGGESATVPVTDTQTSVEDVVPSESSNEDTQTPTQAHQ